MHYKYNYKYRKRNVKSKKKKKFCHTGKSFSKVFLTVGFASCTCVLFSQLVMEDCFEVVKMHKLSFGIQNLNCLVVLLGCHHISHHNKKLKFKPHIKVTAFRLASLFLARMKRGF